MRNLWRGMGIAAAVAVLGAGFFSPRAQAAGSLVEIEPNDTCATAQALGALDTPLSVSGSLDGQQPGGAPNVDFFRVTVSSSALLKVTLTGNPAQGTPLAQPALSVYSFNGECYREAFDNIDGLRGTASLFTPAIAISDKVIAVSSAGDFDFIQGGAAGGSYSLSLELVQPAGPISGRLVDSASGSPIVPGWFSFGEADLLACDGQTCGPVVQTMGVDDQGRFSFSSSLNGSYVVPGTYRIKTIASGYRPAFSPIFSVGAGESLDLGDIAMSAPQPIGSIGGQVVSARGGAPIVGALITLDCCDPVGCSYVGSVYSDASGRFTITSDSVYPPLYNDSYRVSITAYTYSAYVGTNFEVGPGADVDLGSLQLTPLPTIGSVSGQLVDGFSRKPIAGDSEPYPQITLVKCNVGDCGLFTSFASPGSDGRFSFTPQTALSLLEPGSYQIYVFADQYEFLTSPVFSVGADQHLDLGQIALQPYPIRLVNPLGCTSIPASGERCDYSVQVVSSLKRRAGYQIWSTISASGPGTAYGLTTFQPQAARQISLRPGQAQTVRFRVDVPASVPGGTSFCVNVYIAADQRGFFFQPVNQRQLFCASKDASGAFRQLSEEEGRQLRQRLNGVPEGQRTRR